MSMVKRIAIGCDPNAAELKNLLIAHIKSLGYELTDYGSDDPIYANTALKVAEAVAGGKHDRGILLCGTGLGMSLAANKVLGAYAVPCSDPYSVERSILSNNVNILTFGAKVIRPEIAKERVTLWLSLSYVPGGGSEPKVQRIFEIEKRNMKPETLNIQRNRNGVSMLEKKILFELPFVYTVNEFQLGNQIFFAAGSESEHPAYLIDPENNNVTKVADGPGGMMSIIPVPGRTDCLVSVMGLFPPFIGSEAGVFLHVRHEGTWGTEKVISLPFAHRCEILTINGENHLFTATASSHKENPDDWSKPGELYHTRIDNIDNIGNGNWPTELIVDNVYRNHGMNKRIVNHAEVLCISGDEGIFGIQAGNENNWEVTPFFDRAVSEFVFFDLDGDGDDELITIEPFHGNTLNIYKNIGGWELQYTSPLSFGHGLSAGRFQDQSVVVVGNRRDSGDLELHKVHSLNNIEKSIIESNVGATQTKIVSYKDIDHILSSNQTRNEVALYY